MLNKLVTTLLTSLLHCLLTVVTTSSGLRPPLHHHANGHDVIFDGIPYPTIAPIIGIPKYATLGDIHLKLNASAASVFSRLGDGAQGLLSLTVSDAVYNSIVDIPFVTPLNPGPQPVIPDAATGNQITALTRAHTENRRIWKEYLATDKALKQQLLAAVHESYYPTLRNRVTALPTPRPANYWITCILHMVISLLQTLSKTTNA
jgi:hypothetical protein